jgi:ParB family chromosome partitioning protein
VRKIARAGRLISRDEAYWLRTAPKKVTLADLLLLGKIGDPDERSAVVAALAEGRKATAARKAYLAAKNGAAPSVKYPAEDGFKALIALWGRVPKASKRRFAEHFATELQELIDQADGEGQE